MPIRLLKKDEIVKAQNNDKAKEIAEGLKISRRVDSLRELQAEEERKLEKFRSETLAEISKEISEKEDEKGHLVADIINLRREKDRGLKDVELKRKELDEYAETLDKKLNELVRKSDKAKEKEEELKSNLKNLNEELLRASNHKEEAERLHRLAETHRKDAEKKLISAEEREKRTIKFQEETENSLSIRAEIINRREQEVEKKEEENIRISQELFAEKLQLQDQRETIERALKRINIHNKHG